jgi:hypothetical protein
MKEVASEKEAMDEIKRYLEVNGLDIRWVSVNCTQYLSTSSRDVLEETKYICAGGEQFVIRNNTMPPYTSIDELNKKAFISEKEFRPTWRAISTSKMAIWADEFRNYLQDLDQRMRGV